MKTPKLTQWYPVGVNPVRDGVYEAYWPVRPSPGWFAYWDGRQWGFMKTTPEIALEHYRTTKYRHAARELIWRGLSEKPA